MRVKNEKCEGPFLSDREILMRMAHPEHGKRIIITPLISLQHQLGGDSIDLRVGPEFVLTERSEATCIDPAEMTCMEPQEIEKRYRRVLKIDPLDPFILHPEEQILCSTLETVHIPYDLMAFLEGRSTWAKQGLGVHSHAGFIHAGSTGVITLELINIGSVPFKLYTGTRIAQLSFSPLSSAPLQRYSGKKAKYAGSINPDIGRPWEDYEYKLIKEGLDKKSSSKTT